MLPINTPAPDFSLLDHNAQNHSLKDYRGSWILLYFYPKDDTPGCTKEACSFRDNLPNFKDLNAQVIGISKDGQVSHQGFVAKYGLNFLLLSDPDKKAIDLYEAGGVFTKRISYLINPKGEIVKAYDKVDPTTHVKEVLEDLKAM